MRIWTELLVIVLGDLNVQVGKEPTYRPITEAFSLHKKTNENGSG